MKQDEVRRLMEVRMSYEDWSMCYRSDHSIDLCKAYTMRHGLLPTSVREYLTSIDEIWPIQSRQAATIALVTARTLWEQEP